MAAAPAIQSEMSDPGSWSASGDWILAQSQAIESLLGTLQGAADSLDASAIGQLDTDEVKRLRVLEAENARLKKMLVDRDLEIEVMKEINAKKW